VAVAFRTPEAGAWLAWIAVVTIFALAVWAAVGLAKTRRHKKVPLSR